MWHLYFNRKEVREGYLVLEQNFKEGKESESHLINIQEPITFVLYEIGCKVRGKPSQVNELRFKVFRTWDYFVPKEFPKPNVIRVVATYDDALNTIFLGRRVYGFDIMVAYKNIPSMVLEQLPPEQKEYIESHLKKNTERGLWERIVERHDGQLLENIIKNSGHNDELSHFRGLVAEALAQYDAINYAPESLSIFRNVHLHLMQKKRVSDIETDILGITYLPESILGLQINLSHLPHIQLATSLHF